MVWQILIILNNYLVCLTLFIYNVFALYFSKLEDILCFVEHISKYEATIPYFGLSFSFTVLLVV